MVGGELKERQHTQKYMKTHAKTYEIRNFKRANVAGCELHLYMDFSTHSLFTRLVHVKLLFQEKRTKIQQLFGRMIHRHALTFDNNELVKVIFRDFQVTNRTFVVDAFLENPVQLLSGDWRLR